MIHQEKARILRVFGTVVLLLGLASVLYAPGAGVGVNWHGKSGLIVGAVAGVLAFVFAGAAGRGRSWSLPAGIVLAFLLLVSAGGRAAMAWRKIASGASDKTYAATLITLMAAAALIALVQLARGYASTRVQAQPDRLS